MTLTTMLLGIGLFAILFSFVVVFALKKHESVWMTFVQSYVGMLFLFSGAVKAIDPLGTAYKIEQYFGEFEGAFEASWMSFLAPLFPWLNNYAVSFSVGMIVFEIVLGLLILLGIYRKFSGWSFFLLVLAFTFMTGFTYLTGYVGDDATFFNFSSWGPYVKTNMKVTDCGCFGDFLKLEPKVSFLKDVILLIPGFLFLFYRKKMHSLIKAKPSLIITAIATIGTLIYCFSNYVWDIPHIDFRPFAEQVDIKERRNIEQDAQAQVQVTGFLMENKKDPTKKMEVSVAEYSTYSEEWSVAEQIRTEPTLKPTKISEFDLSDVDGNDATYEVLDNEGKAVVIVAYKLKGKSEVNTISSIDTIVVVDQTSGEEQVSYVNSDKKVVDFIAESSYSAKYLSKMVPFANEAKKAGYNIYFLCAGASAEEIQDFTKDVGLDAMILTGDDILMKTIVRSNPGVLM
ncbi:hypothetical protein N9B82_02280, partial [Saprospiraceae bacterium]|nr:hypothetical protein [Saprospiraceae bacterium]